jgi:hypothetical protein
MSTNESPHAVSSSTPSTPEHPISREHPSPINAVEKGLEHMLDHVWVRFRKRPYVGAALAAGVGLTVASVFGAAELALAGGVAYAAYQVFKRRVPPGQALKEALKVEKELMD